MAQASAMGADRRRGGFLPSETGRLGPGGPESKRKTDNFGWRHWTFLHSVLDNP